MEQRRLPALEPERPPDLHVCVGAITGFQGSPVLAVRVYSLPWEPYLPSFTLLQKGRFLLVVQHFNAKAWVFKAAVPPLEIRDLDLQVSGEQCVLFWAACWCFPKWVDSDGTFITTCSAGFLTARHTLASQNSKRSASPEEWISGCLPCMFLSSSGSPRSVTLHCTECLAPKFLACVSHLGRAGFVAHLWGSDSPLLLILLCWFPLPQGSGACRVFGSFHSGLCNIWLYLGFCRAYRKVVLKHWLC